MLREGLAISEKVPDKPYETLLELSGKSVKNIETNIATRFHFQFGK